jgi:Zn-dependent alcohol dehydrogenase
MEGKLPIDKIISNVYKLSEVNEAFAALDKSQVIRSVIKLA